MAEMNEGMTFSEIRELKKQTNNGTDLNAKLDGMHSSLRHHAKALTSMHSTLSKFDDYPTAAGSKMHIDPESTSGILSVAAAAAVPKMTYERIQRIACNVYTTLEAGHSENIYQKAIMMDVLKGGNKCECEKIMPVMYDEMQIGMVRADLFIDNEIVVELKALATVQPAHFQQVARYGKLLNTSKMMLINFPTTGMLEVHAFVDGSFKRIHTD